MVIQRSQSAPIFAALLSISALTLLSGCNSADAQDNKKDEKAAVIPIPVEVSQVSMGDISSQYATTVVMEAKTEAEVISKTVGIINKIYVEEGDFVEQGQVLAEVETERLILNLEKAKADLNSVKHELERVNQVHAKQLISTDQYDKIKWNFEAAQATLAIAELNLKEAKIVAPIAGYVAKRYVKVGNLVENFQKQKLFHIVDPSVLQGTLNLPEQELTRLASGQQANLLFAALPNNAVSATVSRIAPIIDAQSGTFRVTLELDNSEKRIRPGMFAEVKLNYDTHRNVTLLPRKSLISMDNKHIVYVVEDNKVSKVPVSLGYSNQLWVEITSGVEAGTQVVTAGQGNLKDQATIEIIDAI